MVCRATRCGICPQSAWPYLQGKGKGKSFKGKGKGANEVDTGYVYDHEWSQQFGPVPNDYSESGQGFGGVDISEVTPWSVVVRKSRSAKDMHPLKQQPSHSSTVVSDSFSSLQSHSEHTADCDKNESSVPVLGAVHNSSCHKPLKR